MFFGRKVIVLLNVLLVILSRTVSTSARKPKLFNVLFSKLFARTFVGLSFSVKVSTDINGVREKLKGKRGRASIDL